MLREIRIQNLGVIDDAVLELSEGLNVVTGETGAGKTMVVSGLGLLLGSRADTGRVREGADRALVEGFVEVPADHPAAVRAAEAGGDVEDGLILARSVSRQGRSRAHVGGRSAPVGVLTELGELLVAVHGQADQWRLRRPEQHRIVLDTFAGDAVAGPGGRCAERYAELQDLQGQLRHLRELGRDRVREIDQLRAALEEIEQVDPQPGEDVALQEEAERLGHADGLRAAAGEAHLLLMGGDDALADDGAPSAAVDLLGRARAALGPMADHDPRLTELDRRLRESGYALADLGAELAGYLADLDVDPARLAWVNERRAALTSLQRKYGDTVTDVLEWSRGAAARLTELEGVDDRLDELAEREAEVRADLVAAALELSSARQEAAGRFAAEVAAELEHLAMGNAAIEVAVTWREQEDGLDVGQGRRVRCGPAGLDDVEILLAAGSGAPPRSVAKAASGGELSRVMLALELVTAGGDVPTFVFDEIDAGIGGATAVDVGARLARLARTAQVVVVTHLPQVAAFADRHLVVTKTDDGHVTASGVTPVEGEDRVRELARMLGGTADSSVALEHARELLEASTPVGS